MKESVGGISLTMIVIVLILLFAGIMSLTISRSNAIAVKDRIMRIIEEYDGFNMKAEAKYETECKGDDALCDILETINTYSYRQTGICPEGDNVVGYQRDGSMVNSNSAAAFCIIRTKAGKNQAGYLAGDKPVYIDSDKYYYKVIMFYGIDIPVIKAILNFKATGETKMLND